MSACDPSPTKPHAPSMSFSGPCGSRRGRTRFGATLPGHRRKAHGGREEKERERERATRPARPRTSHSLHVSCPSDSRSCIRLADIRASSYADGLIRNSICDAARLADDFTTGDLAALRMNRHVIPLGPGRLGQSTAVSLDLTAASKRSSYATSPYMFAAGRRECGGMRQREGWMRGRGAGRARGGRRRAGRVPGAPRTLEEPVQREARVGERVDGLVPDEGAAAEEPLGGRRGEARRERGELRQPLQVLARLRCGAGWVGGWLAAGGGAAAGAGGATNAGNLSSMRG